MVEQDMADAFFLELAEIILLHYVLLQKLLEQKGVDRVAGMFILNTKKGTLF